MKINRRDVLIISLTLALVAWAYQIYSHWRIIQVNEELEQTLAECQHSFNVVMEQVESGRVVLELGEAE